MVNGLADALTHRPLLALVTLFGAGLVTSLTPCIYPMIPITAGILSGASAGQPSRARSARLTLAYVTGLALFYAILGLIAGLSGSLFGTVSASPWARFAIGNLLLVFALAMFDVIPVSAPQRCCSAWRSIASCRWERYCDGLRLDARSRARDRGGPPCRARGTGHRSPHRYQGPCGHARGLGREAGGPEPLRRQAAGAAGVLGHVVPPL